MRNMILCIGLPLLVTASFLANAGSHRCEFGKQTLSDVVCYGPAKLTETTVNGDVIVAGGPMDAKNTIMLASMQVAGNANLVNASVKSNVIVSGGTIHSNHGNIEGNLQLEDTEKVDFNSTTVEGNVSVEGGKKSPDLKLRCGTQISGDIVFKDQPGIVEKSRDSNIGGKVVNGEIVQLKDQGKC